MNRPDPDAWLVELCRPMTLDEMREAERKARAELEAALARAEGARQSLFSASTIDWKVDQARRRWYCAEEEVRDRHAALCNAQAALAKAEEVRR